MANQIMMLSDFMYCKIFLEYGHLKKSAVSSHRNDIEKPPTLAARSAQLSGRRSKQIKTS